MPREPEQPKRPRRDARDKAGPPGPGAAKSGGVPGAKKGADRRAGPAKGGPRRPAAERPAASSAAEPADPAPRTRPALTSRAAILAVVMCVIALSLAYPLREYIAQRAEIAALREENARAEENVAELTERQKELSRPAYIEQEARTRLHYQYPDERAYVVIGGDTGDTGEKKAPKSTDPWFTQLWKSVKKADEADPEREKIPEARPPEH